MEDNREEIVRQFKNMILAAESVFKVAIDAEMLPTNNKSVDKVAVAFDSAYCDIFKAIKKFVVENDLQNEFVEFSVGTVLEDYSDEFIASNPFNPEMAPPQKVVYAV